MVSLLIFTITLGGGGGGKFATDLANNLTPKISRKIVTVYDTPSNYEIQVQHISLVHSYNSRINRYIQFPLLLIRYLRLVLNENIDISLSIAAVDNLINIIISAITNKKAIISLHSSPNNCESIIDNIFQHIAFTLARLFKTQIVTVSNGPKIELMNKYHIKSNKISVIYNPVNIKQIDKLSADSCTCLESGPSIPYIITAGRLVPIKSQWHIIRVFAEIRKKMICRLLICGKGDEELYLKKFAKDCGVEDDVIFLGWQRNPYQYMARSTVFIQSSISEALPFVLVESMACGCPVVAADCSYGIHEIIGDDNSCGIICAAQTGIRHSADEPLDDGEQSLYNAVMTILKNNELRESMSKSAKEKAKMFDVDIGIKKYIDLIESVNKSKNNKFQ